MATLQQVHITLQQLHKDTGGQKVAINTIVEILNKTPESVHKQIQLLIDLGFANVSTDREFATLTETGVLANVSELISH